MALPNTEYMPPSYRIALICKNCSLYKPVKSNLYGRYQGICKLETMSNPDATPRPTHGTCTCDAHIMKDQNRHFKKIQNDYNAAPPDQYTI
jgi:hypothetical protein